VPAEPPIETPRDLAEAYHLLAAAPRTPIAGGTDLMVRISGEIGSPPDQVLDLSRLHELRGISLAEGHLTLGALTTYTDIRRSLICLQHLPSIVEVAATIGAIQIQNRGTLGGNIANASPAGDMLPLLLALDAVIVVGGARGERAIPAGRLPDDRAGTRRAGPARPDSARRRSRGALPQGGHATRPGDQQGGPGAGVAAG
jgi:CO/xanthine dehydrogenase FAD-binding subunit